MYTIFCILISYYLITYLVSILNKYRENTEIDFLYKLLTPIYFFTKPYFYLCFSSAFLLACYKIFIRHIIFEYNLFEIILIYTVCFHIIFSLIISFYTVIFKKKFIIKIDFNNNKKNQ